MHDLPRELLFGCGAADTAPMPGPGDFYYAILPKFIAVFQHIFHTECIEKWYVQPKTLLISVKVRLFTQSIYPKVRPGSPKSNLSAVPR